VNNLSSAGQTIMCKNFFEALSLGTEVIMGNSTLNCIAHTLIIIGAINWGLIGFFGFDLVAFLFGNMSWLSRIVYAIVGLCGLYALSFFSILSHQEA